MRSAGLLRRATRPGFGVSCGAALRRELQPDLHLAARSPLQAGGRCRGCAVLPAVEVVSEPSPRVGAAGASEGRIEIALSSGHRVSAIGAFDVDALCRVVRRWADDPGSVLDADVAGVRGDRHAQGVPGACGASGAGAEGGSALWPSLHLPRASGRSCDIVRPVIRIRQWRNAKVL